MFTDTQLAEIRERNAQCRWAADPADVDALLVAFTAVQAENERLRAMLRQLEWVMPREGWVMLYMAPKYCQICGKYRHQGHAPDCKLAVALGANAA